MSDLQHEIEKYRQGLLSDKEMHLLEKKALSDPFLADALEGAESISAENFSHDVLQLQRQFSKKKRTFWPLGMAASLLLLVTISYLIFKPSFKTPPQEQLTQSKIKSPEGKEEQKITSANDSATPPKPSEKLLTYDAPQTKKAKTKTQGKRLELPEEEIAAAPALGQGNASYELVEADSALAQKEAAKTMVESGAAPIHLKTESEKKYVAADQLSQRAKRTENAYAPQPSIARKNIKTLSGTVSSLEDGVPIPGVTVSIPGTTLGFLTDAQGHYSIAIPDSVTHLQFSFIGLLTQKVTLETGEYKKDVRMHADVTPLSELVVVGYGVSKSTDDRVEKHGPVASPVGGKRAYNNYLEKNLIYPAKALENKIEGEVTVQFTVSVQETLSGFSVIKSLGYGCDEEVIRLIKQGPKWSAAQQAETRLESTVRVRVKFKLPK